MNFIGQWDLEDPSVCEDLIDFFNNDPWACQTKCPGTVYTSQNLVDPAKKKSTDLYILPKEFGIPCVNKYQVELNKVVKKYIEKYEWCAKCGPVHLLEGFNLQHYKPEEGYYIWHTERFGGNPPETLRHLVFMTYLNDVTDKGETEWLYQKLKITPRKGLTVIWPAEWTHVHRGIASPTQEKYIATGWFHLVPAEMLSQLPPF